MKNPVTSLRSRMPVVKKHHLEASSKRVDELTSQIAYLTRQVNDLVKTNEAWAREIRGVRLEMHRSKEYNRWLDINYPNTAVIDAQRKVAKTFHYQPLISVIMPVYNTHPDYLSKSIESVLAQSYENWELCIVDDASTDKKTVDCLKEYTGHDARIIIKRLTKNGHISKASNEAIKLANGEFLALLDHDDFLWPNALYEVIKLLQENSDADFIYSDEDKIEADGNVHFTPYFKPDWSPHLLECVNYITHFSVLRTSVVREIGGFDDDLIGAQDWDLFLRVTEKTPKVLHIPTILYSWRAHDNSTALRMDAKDYASPNQLKTLKNHFKRVSQKAVEIIPGPQVGWYGKYNLDGTPLVSIIILNRTRFKSLSRCISSITTKTTYKNYEIIIIDIGSNKSATKPYYQSLEKIISPRIQVKYFPTHPFNYSDAYNLGAKHAKGEYLVILNEDLELISKSWLEDMLGYAQLTDIGAVGGKLLDSKNRLIHAGLTLGVGSSLSTPEAKAIAGQIGFLMEYGGDPFQVLYTNVIRDVLAIRGDCFMVSNKKFNEVNGFDSKLPLDYSDVDFCLKLHEKGYANIYLPFVELYHHSSLAIKKPSRGTDDTEGLKTAKKLMMKEWGEHIEKDKFYNPNFHPSSLKFDLAIHNKDKT